MCKNVTLAVRLGLLVLLACAGSPVAFSQADRLPAMERYRWLADTSVYSRALGYERGMTVVVPKTWQGGMVEDFPVVVLFDRQNRRSGAYILQTIDYMTATDQMPECVVLWLESEQLRRYRETAHPVSDRAGLLDANAAFVFDELLPMAEDRYGVSDFRILIGHSRYGYFTTAVLASHWERVNAVVSLSPFYRQKGVNLADSLAAVTGTYAPGVRYYRYAIGSDYPGEYALLDSTLAGVPPGRLDAHGWFFPEADHHATPGLAMAQSLYEIFAYWAGIQRAYLDMEDVNVKELYQMELQLAKHYGAMPRHSLGALNGKGWQMYNEGLFFDAIKAWDLLLNYYPNFSEALLYILDSVIRLDHDPSQAFDRLVKSLELSAFYTDDEKAEILKEARALMGR